MILIKTLTILCGLYNIDYYYVIHVDTYKVLIIFSHHAILQHVLDGCTYS